MRSLFWKLILAFALVSLVGVALAAAIVQYRTQSAFDRFLIDQDKSALISALATHYQNAGSWANVDNVFTQRNPRTRNEPAATPRPDNGRRGGVDAFRAPYLLVDANGMVVAGRPESIGQRLSTADLQSGDPIEVDGQIVGWLVPPQKPPDWERDTPEGVFLMTVTQAIFVGGFGALAAAIILGVLIARSLTSPLRELSAATEILAKGQLGYRVPVRSKDELGQLAESFNQMSADLEKSTRLRKQMTADIAHDLRTPLSILLGYTEALSDNKLPGTPEIYVTMHDMAQQLSYLVEDLRLIALADAGELPVNLQEAEPSALLERIAAAYASRAQEKDVLLHVTVEADLPPIQVDPERMAQVLGNLVANALRYTPPGGKIELSARSRDGSVELAVQDNGSGIAPEDLPNIFKRFYRGDRSRQNNGDAGLGLTIAKSLVEAQGGTIAVASQPGQGATFTMVFPVR